MDDQDKSRLQRHLGAIIPAFGLLVTLALVYKLPIVVTTAIIVAGLATIAATWLSIVYEASPLRAWTIGALLGAVVVGSTAGALSARSATAGDDANASYAQDIEKALTQLHHKWAGSVKQLKSSDPGSRAQIVEELSKDFASAQKALDSAQPTKTVEAAHLNLIASVVAMRRAYRRLANRLADDHGSQDQVDQAATNARNRAHQLREAEQLVNDLLLQNE